MSKQTFKRRAAYNAHAERTPARLYADAPRPAAVVIADAEGRFCRIVGSAQVYPDRVEIGPLSPEGAAILAAEAKGEG